jgi:hypothetical protein
MIAATATATTAIAAIARVVCSSILILTLISAICSAKHGVAVVPRRAKEERASVVLG